METDKLRKILEQKQYPYGFIEDIITLYPTIIKYYNEDDVDEILIKWQFAFYANSLGASGNTERHKRTININDYDPYLYGHHLITALFHELRHAQINPRYYNYGLLSQGDERENFFQKFEEAIASDIQDDILNGQLQYHYIKHFNFKCRGDNNHITAYAFEKFFYNILNILLENKRELITKFFHEKDDANRILIYNSIIEELKQKLDEHELETLLDFCAVLIFNHGYGETINQTLGKDKIQKYFEDVYRSRLQYVKSEEENTKLVNEINNILIPNYIERYYKKIIDYLKQRKKIGTTIHEQSDIVCSMVVDYLLKRIKQTPSFDLSLIKSISEYLNKINNRSIDKEKVNTLVDYLFTQLKKIGITFNDKMKEMFTDDELISIIAKIIAIKDMDINMLNGMSIFMVDGSDTVYLRYPEGIIKISRKVTSDFERTFDDTLGPIEVNTVFPQIKLKYHNNYVVGKKVEGTEYINSDNTFCHIPLDRMKVI